MTTLAQANPQHASDTLTRGVRVRVNPFYLAEHSNPDEARFVFAYRVVIFNEGSERVQLISRHWIIINGEGEREDVRGPGVVGEQPVLEPGEGFKYTSYCPLETDWGTMEGTFQIKRADGTTFDAQISRFILAKPPEPATVQV